MFHYYCLILFNFFLLFSCHYQSLENGNGLSYFVCASSLKALSNSVANFRGVTESEDVELFNLEAENFVSIFNKINFQSFEMGKIFGSKKDFNDISKSYLGMKQGILGLKEKLEKRNASTKEELKSLDYLIHSLDDFSLQLNKTIEILQNSTVVLAAYPINLMQNFIDTLLKIKAVFLTVATSPFWHILGLKDVGSMLSDPSILANALCTSDKEANLNILCWINEADIINLSRIKTENLLHFFNKTAILNILIKQDMIKSPLDTSESLKLVASEKHNLRTPELFQFIKNPFNITSEFISYLKNSSYNFGLLPGSHDLAKFFLGNELLNNLLINPEIKFGNNLNFLLKPNLMNFLNIENVIYKDEMGDDLLLAKFGVSYKLVLDFGNTLKNLNKHVQGNAEVDLVLNDLKSLSSIIKVLNGFFRLKHDNESLVDSNKSVDVAEMKKYNTSSKSVVPPLVTVDGFKYKINHLDESRYIKDQFSNKIPSILYDYLDEIVRLEKAIEMNKNVNYFNQIQEQLPKNLEKQAKAIILRGNELVQIFFLETYQQIQVPFIKEITNTSAEKLETSAAEYETLNKLLNFETSRINILKNFIYEFESVASNAMNKNFSHSSGSIIKQSSEKFYDLFGKIKRLEFTSEHLINAKILLDCFSRDKLDLLVKKVFSASITMPVIYMSKSLKNKKHIDLNSSLPTQTSAAEENFLNFIAFVKKFKDSSTLDIFMQKFIMLNTLVPNTFASHFNNYDRNDTKDVFNDDASSEESINMMKPFTLLFLPEIKQKFQNSISSLITSSSKVTNLTLSNAILCTKSFIDMLHGIKLLTPISNSNHDVDVGLKSASNLFYILKNNITVGFEISFDLIEVVTAKLDIALNVTNPLTLLDLPAFNVKMAARNFMDDLNAFKQHFLIISKHSGSMGWNGFENIAKNVIAKGLNFLNSIKIFITILVFLFVKMPISIKLFLCEILIKSIDMPNPIGISKEIFSNVPLNSASEKLQIFEDVAIRSRNLLTDITTKYFFFNKDVIHELPLSTSSVSKVNVISDTLMAPFTFFKKSLNEHLLFDFMNYGSFKPHTVGITNNTIINSIDETHADVEKVSKILTGNEIISGSSTNLLYGPSASLVRSLDTHDIKHDNKGKSLLHNLEFPRVQFPMFSTKFIQF